MRDAPVEEPPSPDNLPSAVADAVDRCSERLSALEGVNCVVVYGSPQDKLASFSKGLDVLMVGSCGYPQWCACVRGHDSCTHLPITTFLNKVTSSSRDGEANLDRRRRSALAITPQSAAVYYWAALVLRANRG
jgi:hypothetical protein